MGTPLHRRLGVTFLHASVGAWCFKNFLNLYLNSFLLKLNFNKLINIFYEMGTPLHKRWGVTFLHASVGACFFYFYKIYN